MSNNITSKKRPFEGMRTMTKIGAVIPAYNEAPRVGSVLKSVTRMAFFDKIVVVDDGSTDNTSAIVEKYSVELIRLEHNMGKGAALGKGLKFLNDMDIYVFLDADLINLREEHVKALISPLLKIPQIDMSIGIFHDRRKKSVDLAQKYFSILNGQRALKKRFVDRLPPLTWSRFGVEVVLSKYAAAVNAGVIHIPLERISHYTKEEKLGLYRGFLYRLQMYKEVLYALFNYRNYFLETDNVKTDI